MVEACWLLQDSIVFTPEEKELLALKLANKMNKDGIMMVKSSETRSQLENKIIAKEKLEALVNKALIVPKKRKKTRPSKAAIEKRLTSKKIESEKKANRRKDME